MKKVMYFLFAAILIIGLCSCEQKTIEQYAPGAVGYVSFDKENSKAISATLSYEDAYALMWTVTATKLDGGEATGAGTLTEQLLTDTFGPFSVGEWSFTLEGYKEDVKVYEGTTTAVIKAGNNTIAVTLNPVGETGTLVLKDCSYMLSEIAITPKKIQVGTTAGTQFMLITADQCTSEDSDTYFIPEMSAEVATGIHTVWVTYTPEWGSPKQSETFKIRIVPGVKTYLTFGASKGTGTFSVTVNTETDAIVH